MTVIIITIILIITTTIIIDIRCLLVLAYHDLLIMLWQSPQVSMKRLRGKIISISTTMFGIGVITSSITNMTNSVYTYMCAYYVYICI